MHRPSQKSFLYSQSFVEYSGEELDKPTRLKRQSMILQELPIESNLISEKEEDNKILGKNTFSQNIFKPSFQQEKINSNLSNSPILNEIPLKTIGKNQENLQRADEMIRNVKKKMAAEKVKRNLNAEMKNKSFFEKKLDAKIEKKNEKLEINPKESIDEFFERLSLVEGKRKKQKYSYRAVENERLGQTYANDIVKLLISKEVISNNLQFFFLYI
jgi:hypothetical protein